MDKKEKHIKVFIMIYITVIYEFENVVIVLQPCNGDNYGIRIYTYSSFGVEQKKVVLKRIALTSNMKYFCMHKKAMLDDGDFGGSDRIRL